MRTIRYMMRSMCTASWRRPTARPRGILRFTTFPLCLNILKVSAQQIGKINLIHFKVFCDKQQYIGPTVSVHAFTLVI